MEQTPSHLTPLLSNFILIHFWSHAFCFLFSTREPESGPQKNKAKLPTGNVCSGGEFGGWRQAGQDLCQWNVILGGSCRSLNHWQPAREQLDAFWAVCVCVRVCVDFFPSCKQSPGDVETGALGRTRQGVGKSGELGKLGGWGEGEGVRICAATLSCTHCALSPELGALGSKGRCKPPRPLVTHGRVGETSLLVQNTGQPGSSPEQPA